MMRNIGNTAFLFMNEHIMYTQVLPKFTELESAANIPQEERLKYAACYGTYMDAPNEIILLEDLSVPGFKILDKFSSLTDENVRLFLKNIAILHSLSYVLRYKEPETFEIFCKNLVNLWLLMAKAPEPIQWFAQLDAEVQILLDNDKHKKAVKNALVQMIAQAPKLAKFDAGSKHSVIQKGDAWTNNIMFRFEDDRSVECCVIDYQVSKQSNPVADLHYMIFNCTDYATRAEHFHDWIDYYHSQLDKSLANFGLKANYVYSKDQLDADLRRFAKFFLGESVLLTTVLVRDTADAARLKEVMKEVHADMTTDELNDIAEQTKLSRSNPETIKKFQIKLKGIVDSFIEFGFL
ncbi:uncharacterized protein LOC113238551 [Hyposmocoma kahamanoa]|uniref:uncharacterized protein LOC113238551 n=1 Tax=Hyposmocoma kahamanoa TaxID=1477025 RepID=UPI000E6D7BCD|nr:uncharacterized protein LOC113238551 [Hyposmocoma kahamanoa]